MYYSPSFVKECETNTSLLEETERFYESRPRKMTFNVTTSCEILGISSDGVTCTRLPPEAEVHRLCMKAKSMGSSQSYGPRIEDWISRTVKGLSKVPSREGRGDFWHPLLGDVEGKVSITYEPAYNVQQVRAARNIPWYNLLFYSPGHLFFGFVPEGVIKQHVGGPSHGTKTSAKENKDPEFSLKTPAILRNGTFNTVLAALEPYNYYGGGSHLVK
jgi:hypothetical protein